MMCAAPKNTPCSSKQVACDACRGHVPCLTHAKSLAEITDLKNGRIIQQLEQQLSIARARCDDLQVRNSCFV